MRAVLLGLVLTSCGYVEHSETQKLKLRGEKWSVEADLAVCQQERDYFQKTNKALAAAFNEFSNRVYNECPRLLNTTLTGEK